MGIVQIEEVRTLREGIPDDLFVTCVSFEERCVKSLVYGRNYTVKNIVVFDYHELRHEKEIPRRKTNRKIILENARARVEDEKNIFLIDPLLAIWSKVLFSTSLEPQLV